MSAGATCGMEQMVESPCAKICELNAAGVCVGCGRTRAEIGAWMQMSDAQKRETVKVAASRLKPAESRKPADAKV